MTAVERFAGCTTEELKAGIASIEERIHGYRNHMESLRARGNKHEAVFYRDFERLYQQDAQLLMQATLALEVRNSK